MRLINESTAVEFSIARRGDDNSLLTPTTLKYRVDDDAGNSITGWTDVTPESITSLSLPASVNAIQDDSRPYEDRLLTVMADEGLSTQEVYEQRWRVRNLSGIS